LGALTEGIGLLVLVPLLSLIGVDVQQGSIGRVATWMAGAFAWVGVPLTVISVLLLYVGLIAGDAAIRRWQTVVYCSLQLDFSANLRKRLHQTIMRAGWIRLVRFRGSDLTHALTSQIDRVGSGALLILMLARDAVLACVYLVATLYVSPSVTAIVALTGA